jgi:hypothetical protein
MLITPGEAPASPGQGELICEVRIDGLVAAELGPFGDLMEAGSRLAASRWMLDAQAAEFRVVRAADRSLVCVFERRGLLLLQGLEQEPLPPR